MALASVFTLSFRRTAAAVFVLALMGVVPAQAQVVIGGAEEDQSSFTAPPQMPSTQVPDWLLKYATPADKAKSQQKPDAKKKKKSDEIKLKRLTRKEKDKQKMVTAKPTPPELMAIKRKNFLTPAPAEAPSRRIASGAAKGIEVSPWSPRAQVPQSRDLFPEITKQAEAGLMVAPQLAGNKPIETRGDSSLPPVLTPDLMDSMVLAARENQADQATAATTGAAGPVPLTGATVYLDEEGAYSPNRAGTTDKYKLGEMAGTKVADAGEAKPRKLFSSAKDSAPDQKDAAQSSGKLLADIESEPRPEPARNDHEPMLPTAPVPMPTPASQTASNTTPSRRDDDLSLSPTGLPDNADSMRPLDDGHAEDDDAAGRRLIASLSDDRADVSAKTTTQKITAPALAADPNPNHVLVAPTATAIDAAPRKLFGAAPTAAVAAPEVKVEAPAVVADVPEIKIEEPAPEVSVNVEEAAPAAEIAADMGDLDITQMGSAPRLLGRMSDSVPNAAPTPRAAPVATVQKAAPVDVPEVKVAAAVPEVKVETPEVKVETPEVRVDVPDKPVQTDMFAAPAEEPKAEEAAAPAIQEQRTLLSIDAPEPAAVVAEAPKVEEPVIEKPKAEPKKKPAAKKAAAPKPVEKPPEVKVEMPQVPEVKVEETIVVVEPEPEVMVEVPEAPVTIPEKPVATPFLQAPTQRVEAPKPMPAPVREPVPLVTLQPEPTPAPQVLQAPQRIETPQAFVEAPRAPQVILPPAPNLRVETPPAIAGQAPKLRTPKLLVDNGEPAPPLAANVPQLPPATLTTLTPDTPAVAAPVVEELPSDVTQTIYFTTDARDLDATSKKQIDDLANMLEEKPEQRVMLLAYADANLAVEARRIALARALAIRSRLAEQGIQPVRIDVRAMGVKPANDNGVTDRVDVIVK